MNNHSRKFPILVKEIREMEERFEAEFRVTVEAAEETMNYNDRLDGYGFGEADSQDCNRDYEKDPHFSQHSIDPGEGYRCHKGEPYTRDEYGLRNQYGPVDQYVFRDGHLSLHGPSSRTHKNKETKNKEKEKR